MSLARPRYSRVERLTDELLVQHRVKSPPVSVEAIVRAHEGVSVRYSDLKDISGLVVRKDGNALIGVNRTHSVVRRRFTLAHEFAHVLLHEGAELRFDKQFRANLRSDLSSTGTDIEEIEANFFAASLLMPRRFLDDDERTFTIEIEDAMAVRELAKTYAVSVQAMSWRLSNLYGRRAMRNQRRSDLTVIASATPPMATR
jgi:Zn-dependent peptidase ImmA (M78 family)